MEITNQDGSSTGTQANGASGSSTSTQTDAVTQLLQQLTGGQQTGAKPESENNNNKPQEKAQANPFENGLWEGKGRIAKEALSSLREAGIEIVDDSDPINALKKTLEAIKTAGLSKRELPNKKQDNTQTDEEKETYRLRAEAAERDKLRYQSSMEELLSKTEVVNALSKFNVYSSDDVSTIFNSQYTVKSVNGKSQVYTKSGDLVREESRGHDPATVEEVIGRILKDRPFMVRASATPGSRNRSGVDTSGNNIAASIGNLDGSQAIELLERFKRGDFKTR